MKVPRDDALNATGGEGRVDVVVRCGVRERGESPDSKDLKETRGI